MADERPYKAAGSDANMLANPGPPSQTLCTQCHELYVDSLTTPVRIYHHCRSCRNSWDVPNPKAH
jgi:hypothetical protein